MRKEHNHKRKYHIWKLLFCFMYILALFPYPVKASSGGHEWSEWITDVEPTCNSTGHRYRVCQKFADKPHTEEELIPMLEHNYQVSDETAPTCTDAGTITYTCTNCQDSYTVETDPPLGHDYGDWEIIKEPTTTEEGLRVRVCANDSSHVLEEAIPVLEPTPQEVLTETVVETPAETPLQTPTLTPVKVSPTPTAQPQPEHFTAPVNALDIGLSSMLALSLLVSGSTFFYNYRILRREHAQRREFLKNLYQKGEQHNDHK